MKNIHSLIFLIAFFLIASFALFYFVPLISYQETQNNNQIAKNNRTNQKIILVKSDKKIYRSSDNMRLVIDLKNFEIEDILKVQVFGVKTKRGNFALNKTREVKIKENPYRLVFDLKLPACSKCAGISPGKYPIQVNISQKGKIIKNEIIEIELL